MVNIFEYIDYKAYLRALIKSSDVRGFSSRLAEAAGCQKSYFSTSLSGKSHLLPDQCFGIAEFLRLTDDERDYFMMILDYQRANGLAYRKFMHKKIQARQTAWKDLKNRLQKPSLQNVDQEHLHQQYYSNYLYAALHIAVSIPELQDLKGLVRFFAVPEGVLKNYLERLEKMGLIESKGSRWSWKSGDLHLSKDSAWVQTHHGNWRLQALTELSLQRPESLHFSGVQSLSRKDVEHLRFQMTQWIQHFRDTSGPSAPEELVCFNLDFFSLGKN
jgi:uncharacterized protein (TIGR02147 family)